MHCPPYSRVFSLALTLWLTLFLSDSERVVRCPTHGGGKSAAAQAAGAMASANLAEHDHGAEHSMPADHGAGHNCSCPGPSCCSPAVSVVPGVTLPMAHIVAVHQAAAVSTLQAFSSVKDHLLPFATAPPTVAPALAASTVA
jgi:hypothetical protein